MKLGDFSLLKEDYDSYTVGHPKGKSLTVSKSGLSEKAHALIKKLKKANYKEGGGPEEVDESPQELSQSESAEPDANGVGASTEVAASGQKPSAPVGLPSAGLGQSYEKEKQAIAKGAKAEATAGEESAKIYGEAANALMPKGDNGQPIGPIKTAAQLTADYAAGDKRLADAFASKQVDPNRVLNQMGAGSKIATGIGMFLSGLGSGLTGQPNMAMQFLKDSIDKDIEAQKNAQGQAATLWKMNREKLGSDIAANMSTENQMMSAIKVGAMEQAAKAQGPEAAARIAPLIQTIEGAQFQNNRLMGMMKGVDTDPAQLVPLMIPDKGQQAKALQEINTARIASKTKEQLLAKFDEAANNRGYLSKAGRLFSLHPKFSNPANEQIALLADPLLKDELGRPNPQAHEDFMNLAPAGNHTNEEVASNRKVFEDFIDRKALTPTLDAHLIPTHSLGASAAPRNIYKPGQVVSVKGKKMKVGPDGDSLLPL